MKKTILEVATDIISSDLQSVGKFLKEDLKNTQPYHKPPLTNKQKVERYISITPEQDESFEGSFGEPYMKWKSKMDEEVRRYTNG